MLEAHGDMYLTLASLHAEVTEMGNFQMLYIEAQR